MDKGTLYQRMQFQKEFDSLVWQMMTKIKRGETIPDAENYRRAQELLQRRADMICNDNGDSISVESDWLALALYAPDKAWFAEQCLAAEQRGDITYQKASMWLGHVFTSTIEKYAS